jgi:hypothetical protein
MHSSSRSESTKEIPDQETSISNPAAPSAELTAASSSSTVLNLRARITQLLDLALEYHHVAAGGKRTVLQRDLRSATELAGLLVRLEEARSKPYAVFSSLESAPDRVRDAWMTISTWFARGRP